MAEWYEVSRVSIFDEENHDLWHDVHAIDVDEYIDDRCGGSMVAKQLNSGKTRTYVPEVHRSLFDELDKEIVVSDTDGTIICSGTITAAEEYTRDSVETMRYTTHG